MSKGRYAKKKSNSGKWVLLLILVVVLAALIAFALKTGPGAEAPEETRNSENGASSTAAAESQMPESEAPAETQNRESAPEMTDAPDVTQATTAGQTEAPEDPTQATSAPIVGTEPPKVQIIQQADAEYEKWLAATMIVCVSMEYPDFQLDGVYAASATSLENAMDSKGAYIIFTSGGQQMAIHSKPLSEERTASGTKDISSQTLGIASYDKVSPASVDTASLTQINLEDLGELIAQSVLVTIYEH